MLTDQELKRAKAKYGMQKGMCRYRKDRLGNPIEMRLTFDEWLNIWLSSGHWYERGNKKGCYLMSRYNDLGHYEIGNVEIKTKEANSSETWESDHFKSNHKLAIKQASQNPLWRANRKRAAQERSATDTWKANQKIAGQKRSQNPEWQAKMKAARQSPEWQAKIQARRQSPEWQDNVKLAAQKTHSKSISCDSVIYPSQTSAANALAPDRIKYKIQWLKTQMKKFPERFFYIAK